MPTCTPGCVSCMNSKSLLTTVFRNFQWLRRKRGYWPTTYLRRDAETHVLRTDGTYSSTCLTAVQGQGFRGSTEHRCRYNNTAIDCGVLGKNRQLS